MALFHVIIVIQCIHWHFWGALAMFVLKTPLKTQFVLSLTQTINNKENLMFATVCFTPSLHHLIIATWVRLRPLRWYERLSVHVAVISFVKDQHLPLQKMSLWEAERFSAGTWGSPLLNNQGLQLWPVHAATAGLVVAHCSGNQPGK